MPDHTDINPESFRSPVDPPDDDDALETEYDPSEIEVTRGREQGLGFGARDLARQRDVHTHDDVGPEGGLEELDEDDPRRT